MKSETQNTDTQSGHGNVNEEQNNLNSSELFQMIAVDGTPFTAVKMEDKWFLTMGKYRLTEPMETKEQCEEAAKDASWYRIMQIVNIMIEEHEHQKEKNK